MGGKKKFVGYANKISSILKVKKIENYMRWKNIFISVKF